MKRLLTVLAGFIFLIACDSDKSSELRQDFIDEYCAQYDTDGASVYTFYRFANATGMPLFLVFLEPGYDIPTLHSCLPGYAMVYCAAAERTTPLEMAFARLDVYYDADAMYDGIGMGYVEFGISASVPSPGDPNQWTEERTDERHIYRTYIFTEADYRFAEEHGIRY